jgi:nucleoside phosphorylase
LVFSWTVLEEIERLAGKNERGEVRVVLITAPKFTAGRMSEERSRLVQTLEAQGIARVEIIANDLWVGGRIRDTQASLAHAMICLGGGKGVVDLAHRLCTRGAPVLPMDIEIRGINEDGGGAQQLYQEMTRHPSRFFPYTGAQIPSRLFALSLRNPANSIPRTAATALEVVAQELCARDAVDRVAVLVVTALPIELEAAREALGFAQESAPMRSRSGTSIWRGTLPSTSRAHDMTAGLCCLGSAGNLGASAVVAELVGELSPQLVVMVGIAAGMRKKRRLGEVVVHEEVVAYEPAALIQTAEGRAVQARPRTWRTSHAVFQDVVSYLSHRRSIAERIDSVLHARGVTFPTASDADPADVVHRPTVGVATIGSGEKLLRDAIVWDDLRAIHGKIDVAEMEAAGVAEACGQYGVPFLVFRGISDFGDSHKDDRYHRIAAVIAAEVAVDFLRCGWVWEARR